MPMDACRVVEVWKPRIPAVPPCFQTLATLPYKAHPLASLFYCLPWVNFAPNRRLHQAVEEEQVGVGGE
jgi:hypothetical protein